MIAWRWDQFSFFYCYILTTEKQSFKAISTHWKLFRFFYFKLTIHAHWEKNAIESKAFLSESMCIMDSNQYAIELVTSLLVFVVYFYELIVYVLLEWNAFDSIAFFLSAGNNIPLLVAYPNNQKCCLLRHGTFFSNHF